MGPPGCRVIAHVKGSTQRSWDYRGNEGFYVGPALDHYRCFTIIKTSTAAVIVSDTVVFQHLTLSVPTLTTTDRIIHCLRALTVAIRADRTQDDCHAQLLAVESLQSIFNTPTTSTTPPVAQKTRVPTPASAPRVLQAPAPAPNPASTPRVLQAPAPAPTPASTPRVCLQTPAPLPRVVKASNPRTGTQPIAHHTRTNQANANSIAMVVSQPNTCQRTVTFALPPNHADKYSRAYCEATLNRDTTYILSAKWATVPQLCCPPIKPSQTLAQPLPTFNRFALLADDNIDNNEQPPNATAYSVLDHETRETLEHRQL